MANGNRSRRSGQSITKSHQSSSHSSAATTTTTTPISARARIFGTAHATVWPRYWCDSCDGTHYPRRESDRSGLHASARRHYRTLLLLLFATCTQRHFLRVDRTENHSHLPQSWLFSFLSETLPASTRPFSRCLPASTMCNSHLRINSHLHLVVPRQIMRLRQRRLQRRPHPPPRGKNTRSRRAR